MRTPVAKTARDKVLSITAIVVPITSVAWLFTRPTTMPLTAIGWRRVHQEARE